MAHALTHPMEILAARVPAVWRVNTGMALLFLAASALFWADVPVLGHPVWMLAGPVAGLVYLYRSRKVTPRRKRG